MRIAVLCTDQGVRVPSPKGASLHLLAISRAFVHLGHEVLLIGVAGHGVPPAEHASHLFPHPGRAEGLVRERNKLDLVERVAVEAGPVLRSFAPDLVYERLALFGTAGVRLTKQLGVPHVVEVNALLAREEARWRTLELTDLAVARETAVLRSAHHVIGVSDEVADQVRAIRGPHGVTTVPNGFDEAAFAAPSDSLATRAALGLGPQHRVAVFAGTLKAWHGVEHAIRALALLPDDVMLVVVGDGPELASLTRLTAGLGLGPRVRFTGQLAHRDVVTVLRASDVGLAPYPPLPEFAFSPLKVFEYLAAGLPFVASAVGQLREVSEEFGTGELVPPGDEASLAAAVLGSFSDPETGRRARRAQLLALRRCGWTARAQQILDAASLPVVDTHARTAG